MEQLAFTVAEACVAARVGKTALYEAIATGALVARKRGRKTLVLPADLQAWVSTLPTISPKNRRQKRSDIPQIAWYAAMSGGLFWREARSTTTTRGMSICRIKTRPFIGGRIFTVAREFAGMREASCLLL